MKKHIKWLLGEIDLWVKEGIIEPVQATALKARYPAAAESVAWGRIIFFSIGAVLFGLGVILLFAYNWQGMHKFVKLGVILAASSAPMAPVIGSDGLPADTRPPAKDSTCWAPCCLVPASGWSPRFTILKNITLMPS